MFRDSNYATRAKEEVLHTALHLTYNKHNVDAIPVNKGWKNRLYNKNSVGSWFHFRI